MHSRMYTRVLNRFSWTESAHAFSAIYEDSGLFGLWGSGEHKKIGNLMEVLSLELIDVLLGNIEPEEFMRAKNLLRSGVLMSLESRGMLCEDIGKQVVTYGRRMSAQEICANIDKVNVDDVRRVVTRLLASPPTVVGFTPEKTTSSFPEYEALAQWYKGHVDYSNKWEK
jgi:processing peptidase subunit alpha